MALALAPWLHLSWQAPCAGAGAPGQVDFVLRPFDAAFVHVWPYGQLSDLWLIDSRVNSGAVPLCILVGPLQAAVLGVSDAAAGGDVPLGVPSCG